MKRTLLFIILVSFFYGCQNDEKLIGNWYVTNQNSVVEIDFHKDESFKYYENYREFFGKWKSKNSRIYLELKDTTNSKTYDNFELEYKIINDSLFLKSPQESIFPKSGLIKFSDRFKQWNNILRIKIDLKKNENILKSSVDNLQSQEIYIGFKNNEIVVKIKDKFVNLEKTALIRACLKSQRGIIFY